MSIVLTLTLCTSINQCSDFDFEPTEPVTMKQCQSQMPIAAGLLVGQMTAGGSLFVQRMRCRDTDEAKT